MLRGSVSRLMFLVFVLLFTAGIFWWFFVGDRQQEIAYCYHEGGESKTFSIQINSRMADKLNAVEFMDFLEFDLLSIRLSIPKSNSLSNWTSDSAEYHILKSGAGTYFIEVRPMNSMDRYSYIYDEKRGLTFLDNRQNISQGGPISVIESCGKIGIRLKDFEQRE